MNDVGRVYLIQKRYSYKTTETDCNKRPSQNTMNNYERGRYHSSLPPKNEVKGQR